MVKTVYESEIEQIALELLRDENGYTVLYGPDLAEGVSPERAYNEVILKARLRVAIDRINPCLPTEAREVTKSIFAHILEIEQQYVPLTTLRDALLPKLMNGELEV